MVTHLLPKAMAKKLVWVLLVFGGCRVFGKIWRGGQGHQSALLAYAALLVVPLVLYATVFFIHFILLPKHGPGNQFMTPRFRVSQAAGYPLRDFPANVWDVHCKIYASQVHGMREHPYSSRWYAWPLMRQAVLYWKKNIPTTSKHLFAEHFYRQQSEPRLSQRIYLVGNPVVWWVSTWLTAAFLLGLLFRFILHATRWLFPLQGKPAVASEAHRIYALDALLAVGYLANLLPFAGISRVTFLYHYLVSLIFSILIASVMLGRIRRGSKAVCAALVVLTLAGFLGVAPVTFGISLHDWPLWGGKREEDLLSLLLSP